MRLRLANQDSVFSKLPISQSIETANILKYIGDDPDYVVYIRNKDSIRLHLSPFVPTSNFVDPIEIAFSEDDSLMVVVERCDTGTQYQYYK